MTTVDWNEALVNAQAERESLMRQRGELAVRYQAIDERIVSLEATIASISRLVDTPPPLSETQVVRLKARIKGQQLITAVQMILGVYDKYMAPVEVRDALVENDYDLSGYNNPMASIHGVLKRLAERGVIIQTEDANKAAIYRWNTTPDSSGLLPGRLLPRVRKES